MDRFDDLYRERIQALLRAIYAARVAKEDCKPCQIEEGLFLGSLGAASNGPVLKSLNITHILTVAASIPPAFPDDFTYKIVEVPDREDADLARYFDECIDFIEEAKRLGDGVLIHCFVGRSRSVTIVLAYMIKKYRMTLSQALEYVKSKRSQASPNAGFTKQLQNFEQFLRGAQFFTGFNASTKWFCSRLLELRSGCRMSTRSTYSCRALCINVVSTLLECPFTIMNTIDRRR